MIADTAILKQAIIGEGTNVWHYANLYKCRIGRRCNIASYVEIGEGVTIGDDCKIGCGAFIPPGVTIGNRCFVGPKAVFTNDKHPKAVGEWKITPTVVEDDVSIGANVTVVCGVTIHEGSMIGAGAIVAEDVHPRELVIGQKAYARRILPEKRL